MFNNLSSSNNTNGNSNDWPQVVEPENPWLEKPSTNGIGERPVDHFAADETEVLANRRLTKDSDSDSEDDDHDLIFHDMELFCHAIGEPQWTEIFLKHKVTLGQLLLFEEQDLINCGFDLVGDRKKILASTGQMHCEKWMPYSLQDLTTESLLSSPGIYIALNDINKHIEYIGVTFSYLKRRIQCKPEILELGKDYVGISKVASELEDLIRTSKTTHNQLQALNHRIRRHINDPTLKPANHIDKTYLRKVKIRQRILPVLVVAFSVGLLFRLRNLFV